MQLLERLANRFRSKEATAEEQYQALVPALADQEEDIEPDAIDGVLEAAGRTSAQLMTDVKLLLHRRAWSEAITKGAEAQAELGEIARLENEANALREREHRAVDDRREATVAVLIPRADAARAAVAAAAAARQSLTKTASPALHAEQAKLTEAESKLRAERVRLQNSLGGAQLKLREAEGAVAEIDRIGSVKSPGQVVVDRAAAPRAAAEQWREAVAQIHTQLVEVNNRHGQAQAALSRHAQSFLVP